MSSRPASVPSTGEGTTASQTPDAGAHIVANVRSAWWSITDRQAGQGLAEYALILVLIAIVAILALIFLGSQIRAILSRVGTSV
jgi:Flp pilus assembly pilin Flp